MHRQLGVHVSKVRSTTLDVKDWREPVPQVGVCGGVLSREGGGDVAGGWLGRRRGSLFQAPVRFKASCVGWQCRQAAVGAQALQPPGIGWKHAFGLRVLL